MSQKQISDNLTKTLEEHAYNAIKSTIPSNQINTITEKYFKLFAKEMSKHAKDEIDSVVKLLIENQTIKIVPTLVAPSGGGPVTGKIIFSK